MSAATRINPTWRMASQVGRAGTAFAWFGTAYDQRKSNPDPNVVEDQHPDNTDKTALPGTRRHDCYDDHATRMISQNAGELG
jgi:hypothetical protein